MTGFFSARLRVASKAGNFSLVILSADQFEAFKQRQDARQDKAQTTKQQHTSQQKVSL